MKSKTNRFVIRSLGIMALLCITFTMSNAQDVIIKKSGETVNCKITSVDSANIYFDLKLEGKKISTFISREKVADYKYAYNPIDLQSMTYRDVVYTKSGSVVKGVIIEQVPNVNLKIQTADGNIFVFDYSDIEKITKESSKADVSTFGGNFSYGVAIGGGGIIGMPFRFGGSAFSFELGAYYRPIVVSGNTSIQLYSSVMAAGGPGINLGTKEKMSKSKIVKNGISLRGGYAVGEVNSAIFSLNWMHESFKKDNPKQSFVFELGGGASYIGEYRFTETGSNYSYTTYSYGYYMPLIYWKCHWNNYK
ncbi:MAG: hypothetical protein JXB49_04940 [Bacteroidales bacterium]|nr:hypothetical protein [Bacteroidales bacterium]